MPQASLAVAMPNEGKAAPLQLAVKLAGTIVNSGSEISAGTEIVCEAVFDELQPSVAVQTRVF